MTLVIKRFYIRYDCVNQYNILMLFNVISKRSITEQQLKKTCRASACEQFKSHNRTELQNYVAYQDKLEK